MKILSSALFAAGLALGLVAIGVIAASNRVGRG